jgi:hypothetical protein
LLKAVQIQSTISSRFVGRVTVGKMQDIWISGSSKPVSYHSFY